MLEYQGVKIRWLGHDTFIINNGKSIIIDPYKLKSNYKADILLITHNHFDHLSEEDIKKIRDISNVIAPKECEDTLKDMNLKVRIVNPSDIIRLGDISIEAIRAYNINKINPHTRQPFHPKEDNKVGYIITINNIRIYHAGDTDNIEEMGNITTDIALLPVSGTYVMTPEEAADAVKRIKPRLAIPMHYGRIVGSISDANKFRSLVSICDVKILEEEI